MKAVRIHQHGGPEVLKYEDIPEPAIKANEVLVITEVVVRLRRPPTMFQNPGLQSNYFRFRISPDNSIAFGLNFAAPGEEAFTGGSALLPGQQDPYQGHSAFRP